MFVEDNDEYIKNLKFAIHLSEAASSLNINLSKSSISPINVDSSKVDLVASTWGINKYHLPLSYLGVPLGGKPSSAGNIFTYRKVGKLPS